MSNEIREGVAIILVNSNDGVLLGKRINTTGEGKYAFPGGAVEPGETHLEAAARELREETGLVVDPSKFFKDKGVVLHKSEDGTTWRTSFYYYSVTNEEIKNLEPQKCEEWEWHYWRALPQPLFAPVAMYTGNMSAWLMEAILPKPKSTHNDDWSAGLYKE